MSTMRARRARATPAAPARRTRGEMSAETIEQLVSAARLSFAQSGYAVTSMDALCAEAGLTRGALYHHFGGKDGLLEAVVHQIETEITAEVEIAFQRNLDPWLGLQAGLSVYLSQALTPEIQQILIRDAPAVLGHRLRALDEASVIIPLTQTLAALIEVGRIRAADPEALYQHAFGGQALAHGQLSFADADGQGIGQLFGQAGTHTQRGHLVERKRAVHGCRGEAVGGRMRANGCVELTAYTTQAEFTPSRCVALKKIARFLACQRRMDERKKLSNV